MRAYDIRDRAPVWCSVPGRARARTMYVIPKTAVSVYNILLLLSYMYLQHASWSSSCVGPNGVEVVGSMTRLRNERADRRRPDDGHIAAGIRTAAIPAGRHCRRSVRPTAFG